MTAISAHFGLPDDVPFLNVDVDHDTRQFLCPFTIRSLASWDHSANAFTQASDSFMDLVMDLLSSGDRPNRDHARGLLNEFKEPRELRLGYTRLGCAGHGAADVLGERLTHALTADLEGFVRMGVLHRTEDIQVFVNGIGNDVVSDIVGRIGLSVLVNYTIQMMERYPQLMGGPEGTIKHTYRTWDGDQLEWADCSAILPKAGGRALILVPKLWADPNPIVSKERFLDLTSMTVMQETAAVIDGKRTPKVDLKRGHRPFSAAEINLRVARGQLEEFGRDLLRHFHAAATLTLQRRLGLIA